MKPAKEFKTCLSCKYFVQHYICRDGYYTPINDGHCKHPRLKLRTMTTPACKHFSRNPGEGSDSGV